MRRDLSSNEESAGPVPLWLTSSCETAARGLELTRFRRRSRYAATFAAACCFSKSIGLT
jgi:hypothetical protein